jgi:aminodeoxyfutalosine deaminase
MTSCSSVLDSGRNRSQTEGVTYPKIELHVHLEGTVQPETLLSIAKANGLTLPGTTVEELRELYRFRDFAHFIEVWLLTTTVLRTSADFRRVVTDYAAEAKRHGAVYLEGIFAPTQNARRGVPWDDVFEGYCEGVQEARDLHGVEVRLTPDITRGATPDEAETTVRHSIARMDRGIVGIGLGGLEAQFPPELYERPFAIAREAGLQSVPHAGEVMGVPSIRGALDALHAVRLRHGIRAVEDTGLVQELVGRGTVLDVCPISNLRTGVVRSLDEHPLPQLVAAGVACSLSTDDPAMFATDLSLEYETARSLGLDPRTFYGVGLAGALCDEETRGRLRELGESYDWSQLRPLTGV